MLRPRYQYPTRWYLSREQGSGNGCLPGEEGTDLEQEVSGTLSKGDHSRQEGRTFVYLPSYLLKGENSHECIRGRAERMPADAYI